MVTRLRRLVRRAVFEVALRSRQRGPFAQKTASANLADGKLVTLLTERITSLDEPGQRGHLRRVLTAKPDWQRCQRFSLSPRTAAFEPFSRDGDGRRIRCVGPTRASDCDKTPSNRLGQGDTILRSAARRSAWPTSGSLLHSWPTEKLRWPPGPFFRPRRGCAPNGTQVNRRDRSRAPFIDMRSSEFKVLLP
jgi:hypothetical protein